LKRECRDPRPAVRKERRWEKIVSFGKGNEAGSARKKPPPKKTQLFFVATGQPRQKGNALRKERTRSKDPLVVMFPNVSKKGQFDGSEEGERRLTRPT